jgi:hypothetical protein
MADFPKHPHRTARQKALVAVNLLLAMALVVSGSAMFYANWKLGNRKVVTIDTPVAEGDGTTNLPQGDLSAKNYLITGSDNDECIDPNSPFAGGFGNRAAYGERSDTLMIIRVNPKDNQAAILELRQEEPEPVDPHHQAELRHQHRPLREHRLLHVQGSGGRRRWGPRAVHLQGARPSHRFQGAEGTRLLFVHG